MSEFRLNGLIAATFTPFDDKGEINFPVIGRYADYLLGEGAYGVFVCGSTGECVSMTPTERKAVLEAWVHAVQGRMKVIAHVGGTCQKDCVELAAHAAALGVDAVAAVAPFYFKPASVKDLVAFYKPVADACADKPFYSYHMPSMTGINLSMVDFLREGSRTMPNLRGIKFTSNNFMEMMECIRLDGGRFNILNGFDEMLLSGLAVGADGGVGSTYNYAYKIYQNLFDAFRKGDLKTARDRQADSVDVVNVIIRHGGGIRGGKAIMKFRGVDCGNCRPPFAPYTTEEFRTLEKELQSIRLI